MPTTTNFFEAKTAGIQQKDWPKTYILTILGITVLWTCIASAGNGKTPVFTSIDYPNAIDTQATSINASGDIVGRYFLSDGSGHAFLLKAGVFHSIDVPGAVWTDANYINPRGDIVGAYGTSDNTYHAYVLRSGTFTTIDYPSATQGTAGYGIGPNGEVVGSYDSPPHGYLLDNKGNFIPIDFPGAPATFLTQVTADRMVGAYLDPNYQVKFVAHAFVVKNGHFQTIDFPNCTSDNDFSFLSGLNPRGDMTGGCFPAGGYERGYLISEGQIIPINVPGSVSGYANGINPQGQIVGRYTVDGVHNHGYLLTWKP